MKRVLLVAVLALAILGLTTGPTLAAPGEPRVVHAVAGNAGARISDGSFCELVARSADDVELALRVGTRRDIPRHHFLKLLETASVSVCSKIVAANPQFAEAVQGAVTEVVDDINLEVRARSIDHVKAKRKVKRFRLFLI